MEQFYTRGKSNEGIVFPLSLPDGSPSEHWIRVCGVDSDRYRVADAKARRAAFDIAQEKDDAKRDEMTEAVKLDVIVAIITEWSFPKPCTPENVREFLKEAPQIRDSVDALAYRRALFFGKSSKPSLPSQKQTSS